MLVRARKRTRRKTAGGDKCLQNFSRIGHFLRLCVGLTLPNGPNFAELQLTSWCTPWENKNVAAAAAAAVTLYFTFCERLTRLHWPRSTVFVVVVVGMSPLKSCKGTDGGGSTMRWEWAERGEIQAM